MRHIVDRGHGRRLARAKRYASVERKMGAKPRAQVEALRRMPRGLSGAMRLKRFLEFDARGLTSP